MPSADVYVLGMDMTLLDFEALWRAGQSQAPGHHGNRADNELAQAQKNDGSDSPFFFSTPMCDPGLRASPLSAPDETKPGLSPGLEGRSFVEIFAPFSNFDSITPSAMNIGQSDSPFASTDGNALGLLGNGFGFDGSTQAFSPMNLFNDSSTDTGRIGELFTPTPTSSPDDTSVVSPLVDATAEFSLGTGLLSPPSEKNTLEPTDFTFPYGSATGTCSPTVVGGRLSPDAPILLPEEAYPSPVPTPLKNMKDLPRVVTRRTKARRANPGRAAVAKRKPYRDASESPMPESPPLSANTSTDDSDASQSKEDAPTYAVDKCEFGYRVWDADCRGHRISKWECKLCHTRVSRRPDLHRHYKTCVTKEKFFCKDVVHADGKLWRGCSMRFSRRDACHRHLRKRFTEGRCIKKKPRENRKRSAEDLARNMSLYEEMLENYKWRAALPAAEKNRMVNTALSQIKKDMF